MGGGNTKRINELEQQIKRLRGQSIVVPSPRAKAFSSYAIYVACDKYKNYPNLQACVSDAKQLEEKIKHRYYTLGTLYNEQVTLQNILQLFNNIKDTEVNARIVIFFAGHGSYMDNCNRSFFACHTSSEDDLISTGLDLSNIHSYCDYFNAEHQLWLLDCCFSGFAHRFRSNALMCSPSIYIMSAGRGMQTVGETSDGGFFTKHLIKHWDDDRTVSSLFNKLRQSLLLTSTQIPMLGRVPTHRDKHAEGEFVL